MNDPRGTFRSLTVPIKGGDIDDQIANWRGFPSRSAGLRKSPTMGRSGAASPGVTAGENQSGGPALYGSQPGWYRIGEPQKSWPRPGPNPDLRNQPPERAGFEPAVMGLSPLVAHRKERPEDRWNLLDHRPQTRPFGLKRCVQRVVVIGL